MGQATNGAGLFPTCLPREKEIKASRKEKNFTIVRCFYIDF